LERVWKYDAQLKACQSEITEEMRQKPCQKCVQTDLRCKALDRGLIFAWPLPLIHCNAFVQVIYCASVCLLMEETQYLFPFTELS